jgi:hypothetical protein
MVGSGGLDDLDVIAGNYGSHSLGKRLDGRSGWHEFVSLAC